MGDRQPRESDEYYTPAWIFTELGLCFDLDVCSCPTAAATVPARQHYTIDDDGLTQPWHGRVWMNPPYSKPSPWVRRFIDHAHGIALLPHSKSAWHLELMARADGITTGPKYFAFTPGNGRNGDIFMPTWFAAFGPECVDALTNLGPVRVLRDAA